MKNKQKEYVLWLYKLSGLNSLSVELNGKYYVLNNILFYNENEVIYRTGQGWFRVSEYSNYLNNSVKFLTSKPIKRKIKLDFSKKEPFIIKSDSSDVYYNLYLPISDFDIKQKYKKEGDTIYSILSLIDDKGLEVYGKEQVKYLGSLIFNIRDKIEKVAKNFTGWYKPMKKEEFDQNIKNLQTLYEEYNDTLKYIEDYNVEDYLKELEENKEKEE